MKFQRILNLPELLKKKSFFLFGPRGTGKTYLIRQQLAGQALILDLLKGELFLRLSSNPSDLESMIQSQEGNKIVVIDEIQKIPALLDEVHRLIEEKHICFLLTGSSARKLKRGEANLLAGRAWNAQLFPLCWAELKGNSPEGNVPKDFELNRYLRYGGLPSVVSSDHPDEELDAYVQTYLKEEILAEGLIRKIPPFSRFLQVAALSNGQQLNLTEIGSDCQVPPSTVREYYSILEDTLAGFFLEPWTRSKKRKASLTAKFYFFDPGVTHTLAGTKLLERNSNLYGASFEQFIGMELRAYLSYRRLKEPLAFWRTLNGQEVDFLIGDHTAIEVKATRRVSPRDWKGLHTLQEEKVFKKFYLVSQDRIETRQSGMTAIYWENFLKKLWDGGFF